MPFHSLFAFVVVCELCEMEFVHQIPSIVIVVCVCTTTTYSGHSHRQSKTTSMSNHTVHTTSYTVQPDPEQRKQRAREKKIIFGENKTVTQRKIASIPK